jgi:hypothetical protein
MDQLGSVWHVVRSVGLLLLLGLPLMSGLCWWRTVVARQEGDEALARSWAEATRSFTGMMLTSWVLLWLGNMAVQRALGALAEKQAGP